MNRRPGTEYFACDGLDLASAFTAASRTADHVRPTRRPAFLHMRTVRLLGHAGSDIETEYRGLADIEAWEARDRSSPPPE